MICFVPPIANRLHLLASNPARAQRYIYYMKNRKPIMSVLPQILYCTSLTHPGLLKKDSTRLKRCIILFERPDALSTFAFRKFYCAQAYPDINKENRGRQSPLAHQTSSTPLNLLYEKTVCADRILRIDPSTRCSHRYLKITQLDCKLT